MTDDIKKQIYEHCILFCVASAFMSNCMCFTKKSSLLKIPTAIYTIGICRITAWNLT